MKVRVKRMTDPDPEGVALVTRGASRKVWTTFKSDASGARSLVDRVVKGVLRGMGIGVDGGDGVAPTPEAAALVAKIEAAGLLPAGLVTVVLGKAVAPTADAARAWGGERALKTADVEEAPNSWRLYQRDWAGADLARVDLGGGAFALVEKMAPCDDGDEEDEMNGKTGARKTGGGQQSYEGPTGTRVPDGVMTALAGTGDSFEGPTGNAGAIPGGVTQQDTEGGIAGPGGIRTPAVRTITGAMKAHATSAILDLALGLRGAAARILGDDAIADKGAALKTEFAGALHALLPHAQALSTDGGNRMTAEDTKKLDAILAAVQGIDARVKKLEGGDAGAAGTAAAGATPVAKDGDAKPGTARPAAAGAARAEKRDEPTLGQVLEGVRKMGTRIGERMERLERGYMRGSRRILPTTPTPDAYDQLAAKSDDEDDLFAGLFGWNGGETPRDARLARAAGGGTLAEKDDGGDYDAGEGEGRAALS